MQPRITAALKALIVVLLALLLATQVVLIPGVALLTAERNPELAYLAVPGIVGGIVLVALIELVLVCVWRLLSLVREDRIFSPGSFLYVDIIMMTMAASAVLIAAAVVVLMLGHAVNPSILLLGVVGAVIGIALALLVGVMRGLLRKALELEQDLSEVV
ncbi:DUF2975 domain-containing protein [Microbacterium panaciterrae]|uniref:DUF2975 domain-containing protein n=1 Tax=Microbacterium panaciterrae TaxID=985759 RepID=A0ABP8PDC2_9MICO